MKISQNEISESHHQHKLLLNYNNEIEFVLDICFVFYKKFISSQDASACSFTPSCSVYAVEAMKKQGLIIGYINFWDRFSRCNTLNKEDYPIDENLHLLIDPVKNFRYEIVE